MLGIVLINVAHMEGFMRPETGHHAPRGHLFSFVTVLRLVLAGLSRNHSFGSVFHNTLSTPDFTSRRCFFGGVASDVIPKTWPETAFIRFSSRIL